MSIGKGYSGVEAFTLAMGMNVMSPTTFQSHCKRINEADTLGFNLSLHDIRKKVREAYMELDPTIGENDILHIGVNYDGSWHKRGFTSTTGVACVIDLLTGYVIDFVVLCKFCHTSAKAKQSFGEKSQEYKDWHKDHQPQCQSSYDGSSPAMEVTAADILWKRSLTFKMRYTTLLSDGDSKTFNHLVNSEVYGPDITIVKEECINHVAKRLGTSLRKLVKDNKTLGVTKHGSLKDVTITKLTRYYQNAIRSNMNDRDSMKTAIFATLYHCVSTDVKPQHYNALKDPHHGVSTSELWRNKKPLVHMLKTFIHR